MQCNQTDTQGQLSLPRSWEPVLEFRKERALHTTLADVVLALSSLCTAGWGGKGDREHAGWMPRAMKACSSVLSGGEGPSDSPKTEEVETGLPGDKRCGQGPAIVTAAGWSLGARGRSHCGTARAQGIVKMSAAPAPGWQSPAGTGEGVAMAPASA